MKAILPISDCKTNPIKNFYWNWTLKFISIYCRSSKSSQKSSFGIHNSHYLSQRLTSHLTNAHLWYDTGNCISESKLLSDVTFILQCYFVWPPLALIIAVTRVQRRIFPTAHAESPQDSWRFLAVVTVPNALDNEHRKILNRIKIRSLAIIWH
jgi:hypothetical protein